MNDAIWYVGWCGIWYFVGYYVLCPFISWLTGDR